MSAPGPRQAVLADFLRTRRQALDPGALGLPLGRRRRTPGLRREEVASLAAVSAAWYARLEQGKAPRPSLEVLESLADALRLDGTARTYMQALAADRRTLPALVPPPGTLADLVTTVRAIGGEDRPVYAADGHGDLLAWNDAADGWYAGFAGAGDPNITRWLFGSRPAREVLVDWEDEARELAARVRFFLATSGADDTSRALVDGLLASSPDFRRLWDLHEISAQGRTHRRLRHPERHVETPFRLLVLRPALAPATSLVIHVPDDGAGPVEPAETGATPRPASIDPS